LKLICKLKNKEMNKKIKYIENNKKITIFLGKKISNLILMTSFPFYTKVLRYAILVGKKNSFIRQKNRRDRGE